MKNFDTASFALGILVGALMVIYGMGWLLKSEFKQSMVDRHIAHYDEQTGEYVKDSLTFSKNFDTIFVIKRSAE